MDERQTRADRWIELAHARLGTIEPEWWLRMRCGQLADEASWTPRGGMRRVVQRVRQLGRGSSANAGIDWLGELSRRQLPLEPAWWTL